MKTDLFVVEAGSKFPDDLGSFHYRIYDAFLGFLRILTQDRIRIFYMQVL
jgi:hypothetical protein